MKDHGKFRYNEKIHHAVDDHLKEMVGGDFSLGNGKKHFSLAPSSTKEFDKHLRTFDHHLKESNTCQEFPKGKLNIHQVVS